MNRPTEEQGKDSRASAFPPTSWTVIMAAREEGTSQATEALQTLCVMYREPILRWLRRQGHPPHNAEDLTHGFLTAWLQRNHLKIFVRTEAKFRSFLLKCLQRYCLRRDWEQDRQTLPLEAWKEDGRESRVDVEFDRGIALANHRLAMSRLQERYERAGLGERYQLLRRFLFGKDGEMAYAQAGLQLGLKASAIRKAVFDLRENYYDAFRALVMQTVATPQALDDEMHYLVRLLADTEAVAYP